MPTICAFGESALAHVSLLAGLYARELTVSVCPNPRLQVSRSTGLALYGDPAPRVGLAQAIGGNLCERLRGILPAKDALILRVLYRLRCCSRRGTELSNGYAGDVMTTQTSRCASDNLDWAVVTARACLIDRNVRRT